jgi:hypothetical protein
MLGRGEPLEDALDALVITIKKQSYLPKGKVIVTGDPDGNTFTVACRDPLTYEQAVEHVSTALAQEFERRLARG